MTPAVQLRLACFDFRAVVGANRSDGEEAVASSVSLEYLVRVSEEPPSARCARDFSPTGNSVQNVFRAPYTHGVGVIRPMAEIRWRATSWAQLDGDERNSER